jgi:hypothetical protein
VRLLRASEDAAVAAAPLWLHLPPPLLTAAAASNFSVCREVLGSLVCAFLSHSRPRQHKDTPRQHKDTPRQHKDTPRQHKVDANKRSMETNGGNLVETNRQTDDGPPVASAALNPPSVSMNPPSVSMNPPSVSMNPPSVSMNPPSASNRGDNAPASRPVGATQSLEAASRLADTTQSIEAQCQRRADLDGGDRGDQARPFEEEACVRSSCAEKEWCVWSPMPRGATWRSGSSEATLVTSATRAHLRHLLQAGGRLEAYTRSVIKRTGIEDEELLIV